MLTSPVWLDTAVPVNDPGGKFGRGEAGSNLWAEGRREVEGDEEVDRQVFEK